jgi:transcriptional regulator with XRE-family HTH domain
VKLNDPSAAQALGAFLRERRQRIASEAPRLGWYERLAHRVGKSISQEEVAEAVDVSRVWYGRLESGRHVRPSSKLLESLAGVLMLGAEERATLFRLGVPSLVRLGLDTGDMALIDTFRWAQACARRLWTATSEHEALEIAAEQVAARYCRAGVVVVYCARAEDGRWERTNFLGRPDDVSRAEGAFAAYASVVGAQEMDDFRSFPAVAQPGETFAREPLLAGLRATKLSKKAMQVASAQRFDRWCQLHGRVRSRRDFIAGIALAVQNYAYTEAERAIMSTLTSLTSLALS